MMDSFELNKIVGAVLFTLLVAMGLGVVADIIYNPHIPDEPAYALTVEQEEAEGGATAAQVEVPLATLLAEADVGNGESQARKCAACHTVEQGGANKIGPNLYGVVGRPIASHEGFAYSDALQAKAEELGNWTYEALDHFIQNPQGFAPGTKMSFAGIRGESDRADLLVYLRSLSENPEPLPEAPAAEKAPAAEGAPAPEKAPAGEQAPAAEGTPAPEKAPAGEQAPAPEEAPQEEGTGAPPAPEGQSQEEVDPARNTAE